MKARGFSLRALPGHRSFARLPLVRPPRAPGIDPSDPCLGDGYGKFMHVDWSVKRCDHVHDAMFGPSRENEWGGEYGPYQVANMAKGSSR